MNTQAESSVLEANNAAQLMRIAKRFLERIPFCVIPSSLQHYLMSVVGESLSSRKHIKPDRNKSPQISICSEIYITLFGKLNMFENKVQIINVLQFFFVRLEM